MVTLVMTTFSHGERTPLRCSFSRSFWYPFLRVERVATAFCLGAHLFAPVAAGLLEADRGAELLRRTAASRGKVGKLPRAGFADPGL